MASPEIELAEKSASEDSLRSRSSTGTDATGKGSSSEDHAGPVPHIYQFSFKLIPVCATKHCELSQ